MVLFSYCYYAEMVELADTMDLGSIGKPCRFKSCYLHQTNAGMAELADALDSGSSESNFMEVQVLLPAYDLDPLGSDFFMWMFL